MRIKGDLKVGVVAASVIVFKMKIVSDGCVDRQIIRRRKCKTGVGIGERCCPKILHGHMGYFRDGVKVVGSVSRTAEYNRGSSLITNSNRIDSAGTNSRHVDGDDRTGIRRHQLVCNCSLTSVGVHASHTIQPRFGNDNLSCSVPCVP